MVYVDGGRILCLCAGVERGVYEMHQFLGTGRHTVEVEWGGQLLKEVGY